MISIDPPTKMNHMPHHPQSNDINPYHHHIVIPHPQNAHFFLSLHPQKWLLGTRLHLPVKCALCHDLVSNLFSRCWHKWHHSLQHWDEIFSSEKSLKEKNIVMVVSKCIFLVQYLEVGRQESLSREPVSSWTCLLHKVYQLKREHLVISVDQH